MSHQHAHHETSTGTRLFATMVLNLLITAVEIVGGLLTGSLSLISDALHNFSDAISIIISYLALRLKKRKYTYYHTFGFKRAEIFAALINSTVLFIISIYLFYEAISRLFHPVSVQGGTMALVALVGLTANVLGVLLLKRDSAHSLNIKSAYLHLFADALSSIAVVLGGVAIYFWNVTWIDPVLTLLIGIYILIESYKVLIEAIHVLMEGTPPDISIQEVAQTVERFPEVKDIHHIHIWYVGENDIHMEAHINVEDMPVSQTDELRAQIESKLHREFGIHHFTLQFECDVCKKRYLVQPAETQWIEK